MIDTNRKERADVLADMGEGTGSMTPRTMRNIVLAVGVFASSVSLGIAVCAGLQRAGTGVEQFWSVALSVAMGVVSHFAPLFWRMVPRRSRLARVGLLALWFVACSMVLRGQAEFLAFAQQHAADQRVQSVPVVTVPLAVNASTGRDLTTITQEIADVTVDLARVESRRCVGECRGLRARKVMLTAQLAALDAEANEAKRRETEHDRLRAQASRAEESRESHRADPVTSVVARWIGTTEARLNLLMDFACLVALEGAACFAWYLAGVAVVATGRAAVASDDNATEGHEQMVVQVSDATPESHGESTDCGATRATQRESIVIEVDEGATVSEDERLVAQIHQAVVAGQLNRNL
ncbi:conserved hypothetical protein, partial [Ricinus communis]